MNKAEDFDIEAFQAQVLGEIKILESESFFPNPSPSPILNSGVTLDEIKARAKNYNTQPITSIKVKKVPQGTFHGQRGIVPIIKNLLFSTPRILLGIIVVVIVLVFLFTRNNYIGAILLFVSGVLAGTTLTARKRKSRETEASNFSMMLLPNSTQEQGARTLTEEKLSEAKIILKKEKIMQVICPKLHFVANNAADISNVITPIIAGAVIAGSITIPLNPLLFAAIAVVISRSSISVICANYVKKQK